MLTPARRATTWLTSAKNTTERPPATDRQKRLDTENQWRIVWGAWIAAFAIAETIAVRSGHRQAPLSHHIRTNLGAGRTSAGRIGLIALAAWLHDHLYRENM